MAHEVHWDLIILEEFVSLAALTAREEKIMRTRVAGWSRVEQAETLHISLASVDRAVRECKKKYDRVQKYSSILPPREQKSVRELFE